MAALNHNQQLRGKEKKEMKSKSLLIALALSAIILFGFQALSPSIAFTLSATVDIEPDTINLNMHGRWITAYISLPEGYNVSDINRSSILLEGQFSPDWSNIELDRLMAKFDTALVIPYLWDRLTHMGSKASIELTVTGELTNGTPFTGSDTVTIMDPLIQQT